MYNALNNRSLTGNNGPVEDAFAQRIIQKVAGNVARTADERQWLRRKLQAMRIAGSREYIPLPIRHMPALQRLALEGNV